MLDDVRGADFYRTNAELIGGAKMFMLKNVADFLFVQSRSAADTKFEKAEKKEF